MPVILPSDLPATKVLQDENIFVMRHERAITQDIRPLEILIINLMPDKIVTETQLARLLANSPLQVQVTSGSAQMSTSRVGRPSRRSAPRRRQQNGQPGRQ